MFHRRHERFYSARTGPGAGSRMVAASIALASIAVLVASVPASAAGGPSEIQSCQLGPNGENPCPNAGPEQEKTHGELCTLGYGPDGKLTCVEDDGGPDDLKSCEPDKQSPDVNPCGSNGGEEEPGEGGEDGGEEPDDGGDPGEDGGEDGNDEGGDGGGGGEKQQPQLSPPDQDGPATEEKEESMRLADVPVPTRIDTGAGGAAASLDWRLVGALAMMLIAIVSLAAAVAPLLWSTPKDR